MDRKGERERRGRGGGGGGVCCPDTGLAQLGSYCQCSKRQSSDVRFHAGISP